MAYLGIINRGQYNDAVISMKFITLITISAHLSPHSGCNRARYVFRNVLSLNFYLTIRRRTFANMDCRFY